MRPILLLTALACDDRPPDVLDCESPVAITGTLDAGLPTTVHRDDVVVTGYATSDRLAIRSISVANAPAVADPIGSNFATWKATLPLSTLITVATDAEDGTGTLVLEAVATDACGAQHPIGEPTPIVIDLTPSIHVDTLTVSIEIPGGPGYLPADGSVPATVELTSGPDAAGAPVTVTTSAGSLQPSDGVAWLAGDGVTNATGRLLLFGDGGVGTAVLTATSDGDDAVAEVEFVGAPEVFPGASALPAGATLAVHVETEGALEECWWTAPNSADLTISFGGVVQAEGRILFPAGTTDAELVLTAADTPSGPVALTLQCCDVYRQCLETAGSYTTSPG